MKQKKVYMISYLYLFSILFLASFFSPQFSGENKKISWNKEHEFLLKNNEKQSPISILSARTETRLKLEPVDSPPIFLVVNATKTNWFLQLSKIGKTFLSSFQNIQRGILFQYSKRVLRI